MISLIESGYMLNFEININNIKSIYNNQIKSDENFIVEYAKRINYFGNIVLSNCASSKLIKEIGNVAECYLMMDIPKSESIKSALKMGFRKIIIPEKDIINLGKEISKNIIIAKIFLQKKD